MSASLSNVFDSVFAEDRDRIVESFIVSGSPVVQSGDSVLHWRLFLSTPLPNKGHSVMLDLAPGGSDLRTGILMMLSKDYDNSASSLAIFRASKDSDWTVKDVIKSLTTAGFHRYKYDDETGSGCRYWCQCIIQHLEEKGALGKGSSQAFEKYIIEENAKNPNRVPLPTRKGTFY